MDDAIAKYPGHIFNKRDALDGQLLTDIADVRPVNKANVVVPMQVQASTARALQPGMQIGFVRRGGDSKAAQTFFLNGDVSLRAVA